MHIHKADFAITGPKILRVTITRPDGRDVSRAFPRSKESRVSRLMEALGYRWVSWRDMRREEKAPNPTAPYVNTGPGHMPLGLADRKAHDARLAERGERDDS